jgi:hypothetical protein
LREITEAVMRRLQVDARISPHSIENTIYKEYEICGLKNSEGVMVG